MALAEGDQEEQQALGTLLVVAAAFTFAVVALVVNVDPVALLIATEARFLVCWAIAVCFMLYFKGSRGLMWFGPADIRGLLLLRASGSFGFQSLWWGALQKVPIGNCISIIYCSPVLTSTWSALFLGEKLPWFFPLQAALATAGMLLIVDPPFLHGEGLRENGGDMSSAYTMVFAGLVVCSINPIITRQTRSCSWIEVEHVCAFMASFVLNPLLLLVQCMLVEEMPALPSAAASPAEVGLIVTAALGAFAGVAMETKGYQLAEVGKASMFRYLEVPFAYMLQLLFTSEPVTLQALGGSLLIIACVALSPISKLLQARRDAASATEALLANSKTQA